MNNIFKIAATLFLYAGLVSGCDFLKEKDTTSYAMVATKDALESNIVGCHRRVEGSGFKGGAFCEWLSPASGLSIYGNTSALTNPLERWSCCLKYTRFSKHPESYSSFTSFYQGIYRCNSLLEELEKSPVEESYKTEIEGEALFLRAMAYFYLVRLYGDCTLTLKAPHTVDEAYGPRENFWVVYCQIVKDLTEAYGKMRSFSRMVKVAGGNSSGRVCNYAAIACRSLVYLTIGTLLAHPDDNFWVNRTPDFSPINIYTAEDAFRLALADAKDVIENGPFELCPDYRQLFRWDEPGDWQLRERIWVIPRSPETSDSGSGLTQWALPKYYKSTEGEANFGRCRPDRWFFQKWCEMHKGKVGSGSNNSGIFVDCDDPRLPVNFAYNSYPSPYFASGSQALYPSNTRIYPPNTGTTAHEVMIKYYCIPYYVKYYDKTFNGTVGNSDFYIMRLAEVYLIAAEALANLSGGPGDQYASDAVKYVNVLLERARRSKDGEPSAEPRDLSAGEFASKQELIDRIFWERAFEMPFEHHDYFDTHRMGAKWIVENISKPKNLFLYLPEQEDYISTTDMEFYTGYRTIFYGADFKYDTDWQLVRKGLINAYPNDELVYNPCLDVNVHDPNKGQNPIEVFWR